MFTFKQVISATYLQRNFSLVANQIEELPQAFLITREKCKHLVLVDASIFNDLMEYQYQMQVKEHDYISDSKAVYSSDRI